MKVEGFFGKVLCVVRVIYVLDMNCGDVIMYGYRFVGKIKMDWVFRKKSILVLGKMWVVI